MHINKQVFAIAIPAIVSNITVPLLGLIDVAVTGHFGGSRYLGAIAVGSTMFNMLYWLTAFLRMGTAGLTSQACGANDRAAASATLWRAGAVALTLAAVMIALSPLLAPVFVDFLDADDAVTPEALRYFGICIWGAPAVLLTYVLNGWFLGMQDMRTPMTIAIIINVVNIVASLTLVYGFGWKIEGVATGTLVAQWAGVLCFVPALLRRYRPQKVALQSLIDRKALSRLLSINTDIFLRTLCLVAITVWFTRTGASQGVTMLAANALLMQLFMFFSYFSDGFAYAGEALAGKFYGAGDKTALEATRRRLLFIGLWLALGFTAVYFLFGEWILKLLTDQADVVSTATDYLPWAATVPFAGILAFIYDGIYIGLTRTRRMLYSVALAVGVFFATYLLAFPRMGNHGLWLAFILYLAIRGLYLHFAFRLRD